MLKILKTQSKITKSFFTKLDLPVLGLEVWPRNVARSTQKFVQAIQVRIQHGKISMAKNFNEA